MEYRPNRVNQFFTPIMLVCAAVFWVLFGAMLGSHRLGDLLILLIMAVSATALQAYLYSSANASVILEPDGIRILNDGKRSHYFAGWEDLPYGYHTRSMYGHRCLVLTNRILDESECKALANKSANSSRICIGDSVVIFLGYGQDAAKLEEWLNDRIPIKGDET